jgi:hypothetical protein
LEASFQELPTYSLTIWFLAACYAQMGRLDEARDFASRQGIRPGRPGLKLGALYHDPEGCEFFLRRPQARHRRAGLDRGPIWIQVAASQIFLS